MNKHSWLNALLIAIIFILVKGYTFNSGDQEEHLPQVYQLINPALYPFDYFVKVSSETFTVRYFFVWLIYLLHFIVPVSTACFILHICALTIVAWSIQEIALHFNALKLFAAFAAFASMVVFNGFTIGGNSLMDNQLNCSNLAMAFCALAFVCLIKKRFYLLAVFAGLATLFQVLIGLQAMFILTVLYLLIEKKKLQIFTFLKSGFIYLLVSSPMLIPILYHQFSQTTSEQNLLFYDVLFRVRNPNHYLPSSFPTWDYIRFISLSLIAAILHFFVNENLKRLWRNIFLITIGGMIIYSFLLEGIGYLVIGKIQWFKVSVWMQMINVVVILVFTSSLFSEKNFPASVKQIKVFGSLKKLAKLQLLVFTLMIIVGLVIITNSKSIPFGRLKHRYHIGNYPPSALSKMHAWINKNTPIDCIILAEPNNSSFLCEAKRSMPIGWKAIIHEPFFLIPWYDKFKIAYHNGADFNGLNTLEQATIHYNKFPPLPDKNLRWDFRLMNLNEGKIDRAKEVEVHREQNFVLLKMLK